MKMCVLPKPVLSPALIPFIPYNHDPDTWNPGTPCSTEPQACFQGMNFPQGHLRFQHSSYMSPKALVGEVMFSGLEVGRV